MFFIGRIRRWYRDLGRRIFRFWDGAKFRYLDPVAVGTQLEKEYPNYQELLISLGRRASDAPPGPLREEITIQQRSAIKKLASLSRTVFAIKPVDENGDGLTDGESVNVITQYFLFMEQLARESQLFQNSQSVASESPADSHTDHSAVSGTVGS